VTQIRTGYQIREGLQPTLDGTHLVIQAKDVSESDHSLILDHVERLTPSKDPTPYLVKNGDVIFLSRGKHRCATLVEGLPASPQAIALYYFFILKPNPELVDSTFLAWVINQPGPQDFLARSATGSTVPFITKQWFSRLEVDIPDRKTQESISELCRLVQLERRNLLKLVQQRAVLANSICQMLLTKQQGL
jgi:hypothetical protein